MRHSTSARTTELLEAPVHATPIRPRPTPIGLVLYRQPGITVTSEAFEVAGRRFAVRELTNLRTARGPHDRLTTRSVLVTGAVLAAIGIALGLTDDVTHLSPAVYLALGGAAFVPITAAALGQRLRPRPYELWGDYRGMTVLLFSSDEERQYGQVTRALLRAQEADRFGAIGEPIASRIVWW
jgi:hypothetical protein